MRTEWSGTCSPATSRESRTWLRADTGTGRLTGLHYRTYDYSLLAAARAVVLLRRTRGHGTCQRAPCWLPRMPTTQPREHARHLSQDSFHGHQAQGYLIVTEYSLESLVKIETNPRHIRQ